MLNEIQEKYNVYAPTAEICGQRACDSDICGAKAEALGNRTWHVPPPKRNTFDRPVLILNAPDAVVTELEERKLVTIRRPTDIRTSKLRAELPHYEKAADQSRTVLAIVNPQATTALVSSATLSPVFAVSGNSVGSVLERLPYAVKQAMPSERLADPKANHKNTLVISPAFGSAAKAEGTRWMLESAKKHNITVTLFGENEPYESLYKTKITRLWEATRDLQGFDYIIMADATDTLFASGLEEMHDRFAEFDSHFVISGEWNNFPWPSRYGEHPLKKEKYGCLNSGFYMATWQGYLDLMQKVAELKDDGHKENGFGIFDNDQAAWWRIYMEGAPISIDYQCKLSQCIFATDERLSLYNADFEWATRPLNKVTGTMPCSFHANGPEKNRLPEIRKILSSVE